MTDPELLARLADKLFACDCPDCVAKRKARLMRDLQVQYQCKALADYEAKRKRQIN